MVWRTALELFCVADLVVLLPFPHICHRWLKSYGLFG